MATPYVEIYDFFLSKVSDYSFLSLTQSDLEDNLYKYLRSSIVSFSNPKISLTDRDENLKQFTNTLNDDEKELLATWMLYHYIKPRVMSSENYRQVMSDSDFKIYSQANHLQALSTLMKNLKKEAESMNTKYSYKDRDLRNITEEDSLKNTTALPPVDQGESF